MIHINNQYKGVDTLWVSSKNGLKDSQTNKIHKRSLEIYSMIEKTININNVH